MNWFTNLLKRITTAKQVVKEASDMMDVQEGNSKTLKNYKVIISVGPGHPRVVVYQYGYNTDDAKTKALAQWMKNVVKVKAEPWGTQQPSKPPIPK